MVDGDSLEAVYLEREDHEFEDRHFEVRLYGVDAPESIPRVETQPMAREALIYLRDLTSVGGQVFRFEYMGRDDRGDSRRGFHGVRLIGVLRAPGDSQLESVNLRMVRSGLAWNSGSLLAGADEAELEAQHFELGIWSLPEGEREAPWDFRARHRRGC